MKAKERFNPFIVFRYLSNKAKFKKASKILGLGYSKKDIELLAGQYRYISLRKDRKRKGAYIITKCHRGGAFIPFETVYVGPFISRIKRRAFRQKNALVNGVIIDSASTVLEPEAFMGETRLWNVTISDEVREIPDRCFKDCDVLTNLKLGKGLERIGEEAFAGCRKLNFIGLTSCPNLKAIGACAFVKGEGNYSSIEGYAAVALPESIEELGPNAIAIGRVVRSNSRASEASNSTSKGGATARSSGFPTAIGAKSIFLPSRRKITPRSTKPSGWPRMRKRKPRKPWPKPFASRKPEEEAKPSKNTSPSFLLILAKPPRPNASSASCISAGSSCQPTLIKPSLFSKTPARPASGRRPSKSPIATTTGSEPQATSTKPTSGSCLPTATGPRFRSRATTLGRSTGPTASFR